jgi:serine/threonine-protein kinase
MNWLSDRVLERLRGSGELPGLAGMRYRIVERVGRGGMGTIYLAEDSTLGRMVALKTIDQPDASGELAARMLREARIVARLEHPGIVPVHDVGRMDDGRVFYAMKYVRGDRLDQHLARVPSLADRLRIFQKVCDAVAFAHAHGVLHRDLKPGNIMVGQFGEVLVMDWGVAKILKDATQGIDKPGESPAATLGGREVDTLTPGGATTAHGTVLGTPGYMAPEQERGEIERIDARTDIFSLGALLQFMLPATKPRALVAVCAKAMAAEPDERYGSVGELAAEVGRFLDGLAVRAYPESLLVKTGRWVRRNRLWILLILTYLVARFAVLLWLKR